jgi:tetratricopeptide (TPR) repeat protein
MDNIELMRSLQEMDRLIAADQYGPVLNIAIRVEAHCREHGMLLPQAQMASTEAEVYRRRGDADEAIACFSRCVDLLHRAFKVGQAGPEGRSFLRAALGNLADMLQAKSDFKGAFPHYVEMAEVARSLGELHWVQSALNNKGHVLWKLGKLTEAIEAYAEQEVVSKEIDNEQERVRSLCCRALIYNQMGDKKMARMICNEALTVAHEAKLEDFERQIVGISLQIDLS